MDVESLHSTLCSILFNALDMRSHSFLIPSHISLIAKAKVPKTVFLTFLEATALDLVYILPIKCTRVSGFFGERR